MTREEIIAVLDALDDKKPAQNHEHADALLLLFLVQEGYADIAAAWKHAWERVGFGYA